MEGKSSAYLLPDKILIETKHKKNQGTWYSSGLSTILTLDISDSELGEVVLEATSRTKLEDISYERIRELWKELIKQSNYKTEKAFIENAKYVSIAIEDAKMTFVPFETIVPKKIFARLPNDIVEITPAPHANIVGRKIREAWEKCHFSDDIS